MMRQKGMLERLSDKPDCFRIAAKNIRSQCTETDMHEDQRVMSWCQHSQTQRIYSLNSWFLASISMTLCEIATGNHYSIPLECQSFFSFGRASSQIPLNGGAKAGQCVEWVIGCADKF